MEQAIRPKTVTLIARLIRPWVDEGVVQIDEQHVIIAALKHLSAKGCLPPPITPRLLTQEEVAGMLGIGKSNFKKLEREGALTGIPRRMVGSAVRYRNTDVAAFISAGDGPDRPSEGRLQAGVA